MNFVVVIMLGAAMSAARDIAESDVVCVVNDTQVERCSGLIVAAGSKLEYSFGAGDRSIVGWGVISESKNLLCGRKLAAAAGDLLNCNEHYECADTSYHLSCMPPATLVITINNVTSDMSGKNIFFGGAYRNAISGIAAVRIIAVDGNPPQQYSVALVSETVKALFSSPGLRLRSLHFVAAILAIIAVTLNAFFF